MDTIVEANPFTPIFGRVPPFMAGRERLLKDFDHAFSSPGADPNLSSIFAGARGTGKTALLTYLANSAESKDWVTANVSTKPGMLREIHEQIVANSAHLADVTPHRKLKSLSVDQWLGVEWENVDASEDSWRLQMSKLLDKLADQDTGLLITVDEVNPNIDEMVELASIYQHFVREERRGGASFGRTAEQSLVTCFQRPCFVPEAQPHLQVGPSLQRRNRGGAAHNAFRRKKNTGRRCPRRGT